MRNMTDRQFKIELRKAQEKNKRIERKRILKEEKNKYKLFHSTMARMKTSNKILFVAIIAILFFTVACMYIQYSTSIEVSSTLITLWYSFWTVEVVSLAGIKVSKVVKNYPQTTDTEDIPNNIDTDIDTDVDSDNAAG